MGREPFSHTNSKGVTYYLNEKAVTLRGGKEQVIRYFTKDYRPETAIYELPEDLQIRENPRNGFLTVVRVETKPDYCSCEDDDECDRDEVCENTCEKESPVYETESTFRDAVGLHECDGDCCAPRCNVDRSCCASEDREETKEEWLERQIEKRLALEKLKQEAQRSVPKPTMRRCLVEEIKSFAETADGNTGESNSITVAYEYNDKKGLERDFTEVTPPTRATIREDSYVNFNGTSQSYTKLQLAAHIKNLQTILNTLD